uniref:Uncharacterized protein n=1 Tax=Panagrolaimus sp. ES5 TaxID=591445 RepID=A0AC34F5L7_9BILA
MKYCEGIRKKLADCEKQNEKLKADVTKRTKSIESNVTKRTPKNILEKGWIKDEWKSHFGIENPILRLSVNIKEASKPIEKERIEICILEMAWLAAPTLNFSDEQTQLNLKHLMEKVAKKFNFSLFPIKKFDPLETASIFNSCGITISMSKRLRSLLGDNNIFASANKVNELLKQFDVECETAVDKITINADENEAETDESENIEVTTVTNLKTVITKRFQRFADFKKLKTNPAPFEDELWISILGDKGGKSMKLALALGNQISPNPSDKLLLCGMYDEDNLKKADFEQLSPNEQEEAQNNLKEIDSEIEKMQNKMEENETQILENTTQLEVLQDIQAKNMKNLPSNKKQRNRCQMDFCVKRAGYYVEDKFWSCTCCPRPRKYHELCIGSNISNKKLNCKTLEKYQKNGGLLSSLSAQIEKLQRDNEKRAIVVENMTIKIEAAVIKKYDFSGDNMKEYTQILKELKVSKQAWYQTLCGNHVHKLLLNAEKFESCLKNSEDVKNIIHVFKLLKNIQMYTQARFLNPAEAVDLKKQIEALKIYMQQHLGEVNVTPKFHLLLHHFTDFVEEFKTLGFFTEQGIESLHAEINTIFPRAGFATNKNQWIMKHQWRRNVLGDIIRPLPEDL